MTTVHGMRIYRPDGSIRLDLTDRTARVINTYDLPNPMFPNGEWVTVAEAPVAGEIWGIVIGIGDVALVGSGGTGGGVVRTDPSKPGQILVVGASATNPCILIYGIY